MIYRRIGSSLFNTTRHKVNMAYLVNIRSCGWVVFVVSVLRQPRCFVEACRRVMHLITRSVQHYNEISTFQFKLPMIASADKWITSGAKSLRIPVHCGNFGRAKTGQSFMQQGVDDALLITALRPAVAAPSAGTTPTRLAGIVCRKHIKREIWVKRSKGQLRHAQKMRARRRRIP